MSRKRLLILCTGNSARSQMAEGLVNFYLGHQWAAHSAGTHPTGRVHPLAIQAMAELDIDISENHSKSTNLFRNVFFDLVVTVCDDAAEDCPLWLGEGRRVHMGFPDPAKATGTTEEQLATFRQIRDDIHRHLLPYLQQVTI
jgi:arsenate reductase